MKAKRASIVARSIWLDIGRPDDLAPLLGMFNNECAELGGRACERLQAQIDEPRLELHAGKGLIDVAKRDMAGSAAAPAVRRKSVRRGSFIAFAPSVAACQPIIPA